MKTKSNINERLPLVEYVSQLFEKARLDNTLIIACQHILPTNYQMFLSLIDKGINPKNIFLLGKCYSTDKSALENFIKIGVKVHKKSTYFDSYNSYDNEYANIVSEFIEEIFKNISIKRYVKVILIDDGGFLINKANLFLNYVENVIGIEQTSSGYDKIKDLKLRFPVINVARSYAKLNYESPIISEHFVNNVNIILKELKISPKKILVMGKGAIGSQITKLLEKNKYVLSTFDNSEKSDILSLDELKLKIHNFDIIIGCTGKNSLPISFYNNLKHNAVLISASSSDREFDAPRLRMLTERFYDCHQNVKLRDIYLLNAGFPLTFIEQGIGAEANKIQLTRALIFSSILLAKTNNYLNGLIELDKNLQKRILEKFQESEEVEHRIIKWWNKSSKDYQKVSNIPIKVHYGPGSPFEDDLNLIGDVKGKSILELGCGGAQCAISFAKKGAKVTAVDISKLDFLIKKFDVVFSAMAFQYIQNLNKFFKEVNNKLLDEGLFVFSLDHPFYRLFDPYTLNLKERYFDIGKKVKKFDV